MFTHPTLPGVVYISYHGSKDIPVGTLESAMKIIQGGEAVKYAVIIEQGHDGGWGAHAPDMPGLVVAAETRDEVLRELPIALSDYIKVLRETGQSIPEPHTIVEMIEAA